MGQEELKTHLSTPKNFPSWPLTPYTKITRACQQSPFIPCFPSEYWRAMPVSTRNPTPCNSLPPFPPACLSPEVAPGSREPPARGPEALLAARVTRLAHRGSECASPRVPPSPVSLPSQICSHRFFPGGSATCTGDTRLSGDPGGTAGTGVRVVADRSAEPPASSRCAMRLDVCLGAAMDAVSTATTDSESPQPGRRPPSRGRARSSKLTSGSRQRGHSFGEAWPEARLGECGWRGPAVEWGLHGEGEETQRSVTPSSPAALGFSPSLPVLKSAWVSDPSSPPVVGEERHTRSFGLESVFCLLLTLGPSELTSPRPVRTAGT